VLAGYDFTIYSQLSNTLKTLFFPQTNPTAATLAYWTIYAVGYLARPLGAIVFGHVGESQNPVFRSVTVSLQAAIVYSLY
jgi:MHS family proline/betaine transporter-like MFS transporter